MDNDLLLEGRFNLVSGCSNCNATQFLDILFHFGVFMGSFRSF